MIRCSSCHWWEPKRIGFRKGSYDVLYCWCFKQEKHMDAKDSCDLYLSVRANDEPRIIR